MHRSIHRHSICHRVPYPIWSVAANRSYPDCGNWLRLGAYASGRGHLGPWGDAPLAVLGRAIRLAGTGFLRGTSFTAARVEAASGYAKHRVAVCWPPMVADTRFLGKTGNKTGVPFASPEHAHASIDTFRLRAS